MADHVAKSFKGVSFLIDHTPPQLLRDRLIGVAVRLAGSVARKLF
jgi:hypothetical protein